MITVKVLQKEWRLKDITFADKRKLHTLNSLCFENKKINQEKYYEMLETVRTMAGYGDETENEKTLEKLSMVEVDTLLQTFLMEYLGLNSAKK
tara:strand:+ start:546 stop:824 length:279 start_codon:yes stop_codon:yes gene_type:complete